MPVRQFDRFFAFAIAAYFAAPTAADAVTHRVPSDYGTIQAGIDAASEGDTVLVAPGTYTGAANKNLDFKGTDLVLRSEAGAESTVIDCEGAGKGIFFRSGETRASSIEGLTITGGVSPDSSYVRDGGAVEMRGGVANIRDCVIRGNSALPFGYGGGVVIWPQSPETIEVVNCVIEENTSAYGAGLTWWADVDSVGLVLDGCSIVGNDAQRAGGGLWLGWTVSSTPVGAVARVRDCLISGNSAGFEEDDRYVGAVSTAGRETSNSRIASSRTTRPWAREGGLRRGDIVGRDCGSSTA